MQTFLYCDVSVMDMMQARDNRANIQKSLLNGKNIIIYYTLNIPGPRKVSPLIMLAFEEGKRLIQENLLNAIIKNEIYANTGFEACYIIQGDAKQIKTVLCNIEDNSELGRLYDIDVIDITGMKISRDDIHLSPRKCFICNNSAAICARSRAHSVDTMIKEINNKIGTFYKNKIIANLGLYAVDALKLEARTTPKPGLVDTNNNGSHTDMNLDMLIKSAECLLPYFSKSASIGSGYNIDKIFKHLQVEGIKAEETMLKNTNNVNTHKGAIFSLGVLCASASYCINNSIYDINEICNTASTISKGYINGYFSSLKEAKSYGEKLYIESGLRGIRGELADGFPSIKSIFALFNEEAKQLSKEKAGVRALIRLLTNVYDTTLIKRGGITAITFAKEQANTIIQNNFQTEDILLLDSTMIDKNLTCGGCADLLACIYFLHSIFLNVQYLKTPPYTE